jgi:hypothetical protein
MIVDLYEKNILIRKKKYKLYPDSGTKSYPYLITTYDIYGNISDSQQFSLKRYINNMRIPNLPDVERLNPKECYICFNMYSNDRFRMTCADVAHAICFKCQ